MSAGREEQAAPPDPDHAPDSGSPEVETAPVSVAHLSEFAEWLEARLDALNARFDRLDQISTRNTRQFSQDMAQMRAAVTHLHERVGRLTSSHQRSLRDLLRSEIYAALEADRQRTNRQARRRTLRALAILLLIAAALAGGVLVWLEIWIPQWG